MSQLLACITWEGPWGVGGLVLEAGALFWLMCCGPKPGPHRVAMSGDKVFAEELTLP